MRWNFLPVPFGTRVRVRIDAPIARTPDEDHAQMVVDLRNRIAQNLTAMRTSHAEQPPAEMREAC